MKPLAVDLFCGLGGWAEGLLAAGWEVIGFDIERHAYGPYRYPAQLVLQDVLTLHGNQFREADLIVASPPCQEYSYMAMPWKRGKAKAEAIRADLSGKKLADLTRLFNACFRIAGQASLAAGRHIPLIVENVRGAQKWVGRARWHYGSFYLWGDVPAPMPSVSCGVKVGGIDWRKGDSFNGTSEARLREAIKNSGGSWFAVARNTTSGKGQNPDGRKTNGAPHIRDGEAHTRHLTNPDEHGIKQHGSGDAWWDKALDERRKAAPSIKVGGGREGWFRGNDNPMRRGHSASTKRRAASALIAKIPFPLAHHIGRVFLPQSMAS